MRIRSFVLLASGAALLSGSMVAAQDKAAAGQLSLSGAMPPASALSSSPASASSSSSSSSSESSDQPQFTYRARVEEVNVVFTVTDKHGKFINNLDQNDFRVLDDNQPPKQIVSFHRETNLPLRVGLLVDASNSIRERFQFEQQAAVEFLTNMIRTNSDQAFVLGFDSTSELTTDFTSDNGKLAQGVHALRPGGGTALYDAVYYACREKLMKAKQEGPTRRAIVLLSDGDDNQSRVTREEAVSMAQRSETIIYAISTNSSAFKERGDRVLQRLADSTGGRAFFPLKIEDVANAFAQIKDELRSQYALAYKPASLSTDGKYHSIEILAQNHKNLRVRARKGYFAPR